MGWVPDHCNEANIAIKGIIWNFGFSVHMKVVYFQSTQSWETTAPPCPSPSLEVCSNSCPLSQLGHPTISSSVIPYFPHLQSLLASGSLPMSLLFASGGQNIEASASASVLPMNIQGWFPLGLIGLISLQSKRLSRVFSSTTVQKNQLFSTQISLRSRFHIHT